MKTFIAVLYNFSDKEKYHSHICGIIDENHDVAYWQFIVNCYHNSRLNNPNKKDKKNGVKRVNTRMRYTVIKDITEDDISKIKTIPYNYFYRNYNKPRIKH